MSFTYLVGVFRQGTKQPLINVTVAEVDSSNVILNSAKTNSAGFAIIQPSDEEFIPKVLVSGNYVHDVDVIITGLGAGVGPFEYDYLVDSNWATIVAAGRGSEGQLIPTFHGWTFRVYSTLQAAITHAESNITNISRSILYMTNTEEDVQYTSPGVQSGRLLIQGVVGRGGFGEPARPTIDGNFTYSAQGGGGLTIRDVNIGGTFTTVSSSPRLRMYRSEITGTTTLATGTFDHYYYQVIFADINMGNSATGGRLHYQDCVADNITNTNSSNPIAEFVWHGGRINGALDVQRCLHLDVDTFFSGTENPSFYVNWRGFTGLDKVRIRGTMAQMSSSSEAKNYIQISTASTIAHHIYIDVSCEIPNNTTNEIHYLKITTSGSAATVLYDLQCRIHCGENASGEILEDLSGNWNAVEVEDVVDSTFLLTPSRSKILIEDNVNTSSNNLIISGTPATGSVGYITAPEHTHDASDEGGSTLQPTNYKLPAATELTIATGAITVTQSHHTIDTEADAASDDLDTINGLVANQLYVLRPENDARTVVLKHGTGNISCVNGADITLDDVEDFVWALSTDGSTVYVLFDTQGAGSVDAADVTYTPLVLTDWDLDADPGNVDDALDQLAERVDDVEGAAGHAADEIIDADGDTKVQVEEGADDDTIRFDAAGAEIAQVKSGGLFIANDQGVVIGHTSQVPAGGATPEFQMLGTGIPDRKLLIGSWSIVAGLGPELAFARSRNASIGSFTSVSDDDIVGIVSFYADDGVDISTLVGRMRVEVEDASPATGDIGASFRWDTMPGGGGALRETMHLHADGNLHLHDTASLYLHEKSAADADDAGAGQIWVLNSTPNKLMFTDDAGSDKRIDAIPIDISFVFDADDLSTGVFVAPHGIAADLLALLTNANVTDANAFVYAETAGTGTNTILIETTSTNPWTGSPTWATVATLALGTSKRATAAFSGTYNPTTQYLRARCSAVGGTAPQKVHARISALGAVA